MKPADAAIAVTFFADYRAKLKREERLAPVELARRIECTIGPEKARLPWLKLARFGSARSRQGSLRHDKNMLSISGVEADYDGERVCFDAAIDTAEKQGLACIIYTSPSNRPEKPRWRVLSPTSCELLPRDRTKLVARLNGLYGGIFARESFTLSQSYYFGADASNSERTHRVAVVDGEVIDQIDKLDLIAIGKPSIDAGDGAESSYEAHKDAELIRRIVTGEGYHVEMCALAARYIGRGMQPDMAREILRGGRCHLHGGRSPGAPKGERNGRWRGGFHTPEARAERSRLRELIRQMRETMDELP